MRRLALLLAAVLVAPAIWAQGQPESSEIDPGLVFLAATETYTAAPFAERLRIYLGPRPWEGRSDTALIRCDAATGRVRLELGQLEVFLADGEMVATRRDNPRDVLVRRYQPPLTMRTLATLLPPVPAPGLAIALDEDLDDLAPYLPIGAWAAARLDPTAAATVEGRLEGGGGITVQVERSGRINTVVAQFAEDRWLSIQATPAPAGDPAEWAIDPAGRRRVRSLAELAPPRALSPGDPVPELSLAGPDGQLWRLDDALQRGPVAMVLVRPGREGAIEAARAGIQALGGRTDVTTVVAVIYTMDTWSLARLRADREALLAPLADAPSGEATSGASLAGDTDGQPAPPAMLWSVSPRQTRDIAPGEPAAVVIIEPGGVARALVLLGGRDAADITAEVESALGG